jgi:hypothetical protein
MSRVSASFFLCILSLSKNINSAKRQGQGDACAKFFFCPWTLLFVAAQERARNAETSRGGGTRHTARERLDILHHNSTHYFKSSFLPTIYHIGIASCWFTKTQRLQQVDPLYIAEHQHSSRSTSITSCSPIKTRQLQQVGPLCIAEHQQLHSSRLDWHQVLYSRLHH